MTAYVDVGPVADLTPGTQRSVAVGTVRVLLCHDSMTGAIYAVEDKCPHARQPLVGGTVRQGVIQCPKHGACFNLSTGQPTNTVTTHPLNLYALEIKDGRILVSSLPLQHAATQSG